MKLKSYNEQLPGYAIVDVIPKKHQEDTNGIAPKGEWQVFIEKDGVIVCISIILSSDIPFKVLGDLGELAFEHIPKE